MKKLIEKYREYVLELDKHNSSARHHFIAGELVTFNGFMFWVIHGYIECRLP